MNANDITPKVDPRLKRIQKVAGVFRILFFICAAIFGFVGLYAGFVDLAHPHPSESYGFFYLIHAAEFWVAYKLFLCFSRGDLFNSNTVRWMRWIGIMSVLIGSGGVFNVLFDVGHLNYAPSWAMGVVACFQLIFFELVFNVVPGLVIIFIAWIMDEGRKIQEEQALTV